MSIDFQRLASSLLQRSRSLLQEWFPAGRVYGHEFKIGDLAGAEGESLSINLNTGQWKDFATGDAGGDLIALYSAMEGIEQGEAAKRLLASEGSIMARIPADPKPKVDTRGEWRPIMPVPADAPKPPDEFYRREGKDWVRLVTKARWAYTDHTGALLGYVCRFEWYNAKGEIAKDVIPQVYSAHVDGKRQWRWRSFPEPRPLYNLKELAERPDAPIIIVEGEKKVEALRKLAPQYVGIAWAGGARAWRKSDWTPLRGRKILLWPDADQQTVKTEREADRYGVAIGELIPRDHQPGILAMWEIGHHVLPRSPEVKIILPEGKPDGWDAADAVAEGWEWADFKQWALPLVQQLKGSNDGTGESAAAARSAGIPAQATSRQPGGSDQDDDSADDRRGSGERPDADGEHDAQSHADDQRPGSGSGGAVEGVERRDETASPGAGGDRGASDRTAGGARGDGAHRALSRTDARSGRDGKHEGSVRVRTEADPAQPAAQPQGQVGSWLAWGLDRNGNGLPYTNLNNAVRVMESDPNLRELCWFDEFLQRILTGDPVREWSDEDDIALTLYMQREIGLTKMGLDVVRNAVVATAMRDRRNCVRDWMNSLSWDGVTRMDHFFSDVFGAEDNDYVRAAGRNFWISIVARVFRPGCKFDNMIVLEGSQGLGKSQALAIIGGDWFAEQHESATNSKAFAEVLKGKLVVEISEMDAFSKAEVNTIKKVVSCCVDRYRASYGRHAQDHPRQCVMVGTTNKDDWNRDETGARRFWPIRCSGLVRLDLLAENRAMLFAEAVAAFKAGGKWWEMPEERTRQEQRARFDADPWLGEIGRYLVGRSETNTNDILLACLKYNLREVTRSEQMRVASCLRVLGWTNKGNVKRNGIVTRVWVNGADGSVDGSGHEVATGRSLPEDSDPFQ